MTHIAYVCSDRGVAIDGTNGASTHVRELARALGSRGAAVTILAPGARATTDPAVNVIDIDTDPLLPALRRLTADEGDPPDVARVHGSEVHGLLLNQPLLEELERLHARTRVDAVYERYSLWSIAGLQFARRRALPFLLEVNAPLVAQQGEYRRLENVLTARATERLLFEQADRLIVPSQDLARYVTTRGAHARNVRVLPCGVAGEFLDARRPAGKRDDSTFVIGFVGSLKPWHGINVLLDAFARLVSRRPGYRLLVVGDGPMRATIEGFARDCPSPDHVEILGAVPYAAVPAQLVRMDVGAAPYPALSAFYFSPLKIFEYAAAGVPIVASASGQIAELLAHRRTAMLHPPGSTSKLVRHVEELRERPELRARLARRARLAVAKPHTWDRLAARLLGILAHVQGHR